MERSSWVHGLVHTCSGEGTDLHSLPHVHESNLLDEVDVESLRRIAEVPMDDLESQLDRGKLLWTRPKASSSAPGKASTTAEGTVPPRRERRERTKRKTMDL